MGRGLGGAEQPRSALCGGQCGGEDDRLAQSAQHLAAPAAGQREHTAHQRQGTKRAGRLVRRQPVPAHVDHKRNQGKEKPT